VERSYDSGMAHPHLANTEAVFAARVHRSKNRLVSIPAAVQRRLDLRRRAHNFITLISIRRGNSGRWNHHYVKLTFDNEFAIPSDVTGIQPGDQVEVKVHRVIRDEPAPGPPGGVHGAALLLELAAERRPGWRTDGARDVDRYLRGQARGS